MKYQEMMDRANLYKDLQQVMQNKPKLIAEKQVKIASLEQKIMELQSGQGAQSFKQQAYGLLNPKRYLSTVSLVEMQMRVNQLSLELEAEQSLLEKLETIHPIETVDLHAVQVPSK